VADEIKSAEVRERLVDALQLDLVGPAGQLGNPAEVLPQAPSRWYLTGFLVPLGAESEQRTDEASTEEMDQPGESGGLDDDVPPESAAAKRRYMPSSAGLSVLVPVDAHDLHVAVSWGDYHLRSENPEQWERKPRTETLTIDLSKASEKAREKEVQESAGLFVAYLARPVGAAATEAGLPERGVSFPVEVERIDEASPRNP
jgi:hypothetical protein